MRIALLDCHDLSYQHVASFTRPRKENYCKRYGYDLLYYNFEDIGRFPTWGKVLGAKEYLPKYDVLCFLDTDILIMNPHIRVEDQIDDVHGVFIGFMPDFHSGYMTHLSTSAWIMRNTDWTKGFLDTWWNATKYLDQKYPETNEWTPATRGFGGIYHEQSAYSYLYDTQDDCRAQTKIMPFCWWNHRECNYQRGDFLVHFARQGNKVGRMQAFLASHIL